MLVDLFVAVELFLLIGSLSMAEDMDAIVHGMGPLRLASRLATTSSSFSSSTATAAAAAAAAVATATATTVATSRTSAGTVTGTSNSAGTVLGTEAGTSAYEERRRFRKLPSGGAGSKSMELGYDSLDRVRGRGEAGARHHNGK